MTNLDHAIHTIHRINHELHSELGTRRGPQEIELNEALTLLTQAVIKLEKVAAQDKKNPGPACQPSGVSKGVSDDEPPNEVTYDRL